MMPEAERDPGPDPEDVVWDAERDLPEWVDGVSENEIGGPGADW